MAVVTPPLFQTLDSVYSGADLGLPYRDLISEGVAGASDLAVAQRGAGANMSVDVAAGVAWIRGDDSALQPVYRCYNDGTVNLAIAAADATNPRIDLVIAEVRDAGFSGVSTDWRLRVVTGTPAASPAAPATPNNAIVLARVSVPANDTAITDSQITDYRPRAGLFAALGVPTVTALPLQPYDGQVVDYLADANNGVIWRLKYRAASASTYKWEFIGGSSLTGRVAAAESTTSTSYTNLATVGPDVVLKLAGEYRVMLGAQDIRAVAAAAAVYMSVAQIVGGSVSVEAVDANACRHDGLPSLSAARDIDRLSVTAADTTLRARYRVGASTGSYQQRWMTVTPIRVG